MGRPASFAYAIIEARASRGRMDAALRALAGGFVCVALTCAPERRGVDAAAPLPLYEPTSAWPLAVDADVVLGPLPSAYRPSAVLTFADDEALAPFTALPGPLGTVRVGLDLEISAARDLDDLRARVRQRAPLLRRLEQRGARVVVGILRTPRWLAERDEGARIPASGWTEREASPPRDPAGLEQLAYETVWILHREFGTSPLYEFWNEPNTAAFWLGTRDQLFRAYAAFALGARRADPAAKVGGLALGSATATRSGDGFPRHVPLLYSFLQFASHPPADVNGGAPLPLDFVSWHCFNRAPWEDWTQSADAVREWLAETGFPRELPQIVSEWALWTTFPERSEPGRDGARGAAYLVASLHLIEAARIAGHSIAALQDDSVPPPGDLLEGGFGLITRDPELRKSSFAALELLAQLADHKVQTQLAPQAAGAGIGALATAAGSRCAILLHRHPVPAHVAASAMLREAGFERFEQLDISAERVEAFMRRETELPSSLPQRTRDALERARVAAEASARAPDIAQVSLQLRGCPQTSHRIYRIGAGAADPLSEYRRARAGGLAHAEALERARAFEGPAASGGPGVPSAVALERHAVALVVLEP
jgi:hypothetical protein